MLDRTRINHGIPEHGVFCVFQPILPDGIEHWKKEGGRYELRDPKSQATIDARLIWCEVANIENPTRPVYVDMFSLLAYKNTWPTVFSRMQARYPNMSTKEIIILIFDKRV